MAGVVPAAITSLMAGALLVAYNFTASSRSEDHESHTHSGAPLEADNGGHASTNKNGISNVRSKPKVLTPNSEPPAGVQSTPPSAPAVAVHSGVGPAVHRSQNTTSTSLNPPAGGLSAASTPTSDASNSTGVTAGTTSISSKSGTVSTSSRGPSKPTPAPAPAGAIVVPVVDRSRITKSAPLKPPAGGLKGASTPTSDASNSTGVTAGTASISSKPGTRFTSSSGPSKSTPAPAPSGAVVRPVVERSRITKSAPPLNPPAGGLSGASTPTSDASNSTGATAGPTGKGSSPTSGSTSSSDPSNSASPTPAPAGVVHSGVGPVVDKSRFTTSASRPPAGGLRGSSTPGNSSVSVDKSRHGPRNGIGALLGDYAAINKNIGASDGLAKVGGPSASGDSSVSVNKSRGGPRKGIGALISSYADLDKNSGSSSDSEPVSDVPEGTQETVFALNPLTHTRRREDGPEFKAGSIEDARRYGSQLGPANVKWLARDGFEAQDPSATQQMKSFILFQEFVGDDMMGGVQSAKRTVVDYLYECFESRGCCLKNLQGTPDQALTRKVLDLHQKISNFSGWSGHSVAIVSAAADTGTVYFVNSGVGSQRHGAPPKPRQGSPYANCYGLMKFDNVDRATIAYVLDMSELSFNSLDKYAQVFGDEDSFYAGVLAELSLSAQKGNGHQLGNVALACQSDNGIAGMPGCTGIEYIAQSTGDCSFRAVMLGFYALYFHMLSAEAAKKHQTLDGNQVYRQWWEYEHTIFLKELTHYVKNQSPDRMSAAELTALQVRIHNMRAHAVSISAFQSMGVLDGLERDALDGLAKAQASLMPPWREFRSDEAVLKDLSAAVRGAKALRCGSHVGDPGAIDHIPVMGTTKSFSLKYEYIRVRPSYTSAELLKLLRHYLSFPDVLIVRNLAAAQFPYAVYAWCKDVVAAPPPTDSTKAGELKQITKDIWDVYIAWAQLIGVPHNSRLKALLETPQARVDCRNASDGDLVIVLLFIGLAHLHDVNRKSPMPTEPVREDNLIDPRSAHADPHFVLHTQCYVHHEHILEFVSARIRTCSWGTTNMAPQRMVRYLSEELKLTSSLKLTDSDHKHAWAQLLAWLRLSLAADGGVVMTWNAGMPELIQYHPESEEAVKPFCPNKLILDVERMLTAIDSCLIRTTRENGFAPFIMAAGPGLGTCDDAVSYDAQLLTPSKHAVEPGIDTRGDPAADRRRGKSRPAFYGLRTFITSAHRLPASQVFVFQRLVQERFGNQAAFESKIAAYLTFLLAAKEHEDAHEIAYACAATLYMWEIMGYSDASSMSDLLFSPAKLRELSDFMLKKCTDCGSGDVGVIRSMKQQWALDEWESGQRMAPPRARADSQYNIALSKYNDRQTNLYAGSHPHCPQTVAKMAARYHMFLLPFMDQEEFDKFVDQHILNEVFDPRNPFSLGAHILYGRLVKPKWEKYCQQRDAQGRSISVASVSYKGADGNKYAAVVDTSSGIRCPLHRFMVQEVPFDLPNKYIALNLTPSGAFKANAPIFTCMDRFKWKEVRGTGDVRYQGVPCDGIEGTRKVQYSVVVTADGQCRRGTATGDIMLEPTTFAATSTSCAVLCERLGQLVDMGDIMIWRSPPSAAASRVEIDIIDYGVSFCISQDGHLTYNDPVEHEVCVHGCAWTNSMDNAFLVREKKESGDAAYFIVLFEHVFAEKVPRRMHRVNLVFRSTNGLSTWADMRKMCHKIPMHMSGLTLSPPSYEATWAYVNSSIVYRCPDLGLRLYPLLQAFQDSRTLAPRALTRLDVNFPLLQEAHQPLSNSLLDIGKLVEHIHKDVFLVKETCTLFSEKWRGGYTGQNEARMADKAQRENYRMRTWVQGIFANFEAFKSKAGESSDAAPDNAGFPANMYTIMIKNLVRKEGSAKIEVTARGVFVHNTSFLRTCVPTEVPTTTRLQPVVSPDQVNKCPLKFDALVHPLMLPPVRLAAVAASGGASAAEALGVLWSYVAFTAGESHKSDTERLANLMYFFMRGFRPKEEQYNIARDVMRDMRSNTAKVHAMVMGSGKTAMITPLCLLDSFYQDVSPAGGAKPTARCTAVVLPRGLLRQSAAMLARDLAPYCMVPMRVISNAGNKMHSGLAYVMHDTTLKLMIANGNATPRKTGGIDLPIQYIFDEVDSLCNPFTSELNIPTSCPDALSEACKPIVRLDALFLKLSHAVQSSSSTMILEDVPGLKELCGNQTSYQRILNECKTMYNQAINQKHRQHFGLASYAEYAAAADSAPISHQAIPFTHADTPAIGSKYSNIVYSMIVTSIAYAATPVLPAEYVLALYDKAKAQSVLPKQCGGKVVTSALFKELVNTMGVKGDLRELSQGDLQAVCAKAAVRSLFMREVVAKEFRVQPARHNITGIEMLMSWNAPRRSAFTGTPEALGHEDYDPKAIKFEAQEKPDPPDGLHKDVFVYEEPRFLDSFARLDEFRKKQGFVNRVRVIIDGGCELMHESIEEVHKYLKGSTNDPLLFWDKITTVPMLHTEGGQSQWSGKDTGHMGVYYKHANTTGIDAKLDDGTVGVLTVNDNMRYRDFAQALYRLRKIEKKKGQSAPGHWCIVALPRRVLDKIDLSEAAKQDVARQRLRDPRAPVSISRDELLRWLHTNDAKYNMKQRSMIESQCLRGLLRGNKGVLAKHGENAFLCYFPSVLIRDITSAFKSWYQTLATDCDQSSTLCRSHFTGGRLEKAVHKIMGGMMSNSTACDLEMEVEQEQEQQKVQQQESESEMESEQERALEHVARPYLWFSLWTFNSFGSSVPDRAPLCDMGYLTADLHFVLVSPYAFVRYAHYVRHRPTLTEYVGNRATRCGGLFVVIYMPSVGSFERTPGNKWRPDSTKSRVTHTMVLPDFEALALLACMVVLPQSAASAEHVKRQKALQTPMIMLDFGLNMRATSANNLLIAWKRNWPASGPQHSGYMDSAFRAFQAVVRSSSGFKKYC